VAAYGASGGLAMPFLGETARNCSFTNGREFDLWYQHECRAASRCSSNYDEMNKIDL